ncbi:coenzyme F420-0:L-glutamate ligase [Microbacterium testaceum]|uniref:coenzyme F420-0:L-glutamate ligase n=1 Tax=Microbacterium testaceum TaxID=2033 RepID=UPI0009BCD1BF
MSRAWHQGQADAAIGTAGVHVFEDLRGRTDAEGRPLQVTMPCVADELAAPTDLVEGKAARLPVAAVRGRADLVGSLDLPDTRSIVRPAERDMFRLGVDEAWAQGYWAGVNDR